MSARFITVGWVAGFCSGGGLTALVAGRDPGVGLMLFLGGLVLLFVAYLATRAEEDKT